MTLIDALPFDLREVLVLCDLEGSCASSPRAPRNLPRAAMTRAFGGVDGASTIPAGCIPGGPS